MKCQHCGTKEILPFKCPYCNGYFCAEHRLPENHECPEIWKARVPREVAPRVTVESKTPYEYRITFGPRPTRTFWFSPTEIRHLAIGALLVTAVGFSMVVFRFQIEIIIGSALIIVLVFLLHEIAHKLIAQHYGLWAEFRLVMSGVLLTLISIVSPVFKIISPGAVMIAGSADKDIVGKTAIAGPSTNLSLSIISFVPLGFLSTPFYEIALIGAAFNAWIAFINLFPVGVLDGWKVFNWNKTMWSLVFIPALILTVLTFSMLFSI